jgi:hypothetical protein
LLVVISAKAEIQVVNDQKPPKGGFCFPVMPADAGIQVLNGIARLARDLNS